MEQLIPIFAIGFFWWAIVSIIKIATDASTRNRLINKGLVNEDVKHLFQVEKENPFPSLKMGLVLLFMGGGLLVSSEMENEKTVAGIILLSGGLAFVVYYFLAKKGNS